MTCHLLQENHRRSFNERGMSPISRKLHQLFKSHPWHGIPAEAGDGEAYHVYVELVPSDTVKYEIDKATGHLKVDRPQLYSSQSPTLYGFIPQTYCGQKVGALCVERTGRGGIAGDGDPLDICVITDNNILHADILVSVIPIGGLRVLDGNQADDKIVSVLRSDATYGNYRDISQLPGRLVDRLRHYFLTYKQLPDSPRRPIEVTHVYGRDEALEVIRRSQEDYRADYGDAQADIAHLLSKLEQLTKS